MSIKEGIEIANEGIAILKSDKSFVRFVFCAEIVHFIFSLVFFSLLFLPLILSGSALSYFESSVPEYVYYTVIFVYYLIAYCISFFFLTALAHYAFNKFYRVNVTFKNSIKVAKSNFSRILVWALISATVGVILRLIRKKAKSASDLILSSVGEIAWSLGTLFVVPIMILENKRPSIAIRESFSLYIKTFGKNIVAGFRSFFWLLPYYLVAFFVFLAAAAVYSLTNNLFFTVILALIGILWLIYVFMLGSALKLIITVGLYIYAKTGKLPTGFSEAALKNSVK